jgi:transcriptional regulator with XRE-family HTH domain
VSTAVAISLETIREKGGVSNREVAQFLNTTPETVSRWKSGAVTPQRVKFEKLATLAWLVDQLAEFYSTDEARMWLFTPQRLLRSKRPADLITDGRLEDVLAIIEQMRDGAVV